LIEKLAREAGSIHRIEFSILITDTHRYYLVSSPCEEPYYQVLLSHGSIALQRPMTVRTLVHLNMVVASFSRNAAVYHECVYHIPAFELAFHHPAVQEQQTLRPC
jgi:hypothetical protein